MIRGGFASLADSGAGKSSGEPQLREAFILMRRLWKQVTSDTVQLIDHVHLRLRVTRVSGPRRFNLGPDDVVVVTPIVDGTYWIDAFLRHHRKIGAAGFVFVDTGSSDGTLEALSRETDVIVLTAPSFKHQNKLREAAAKRYASGAWALFVDIDEMFEFSLEGVEKLQGLTQHLSQHGFSSLPALMLDMFPEGPIGTDTNYEDALRRYVWFETETIQWVPHTDKMVKFRWLLEQNLFSCSTPRVAFGGVRRRVFGENPCLTKHPLIHILNGVTPGRHPHCSIGTRVANFQGLIRHYKFTNRLAVRDWQAVERGVVLHGENRKRLAVLENNSALVMCSDASRRFTDAEFILNEVFLCPKGTGPG